MANPKMKRPWTVALGNYRHNGRGLSSVQSSSKPEAAPTSPITRLPQTPLTHQTENKSAIMVSEIRKID